MSKKVDKSKPLRRLPIRPVRGKSGEKAMFSGTVIVRLTPEASPINGNIENINNLLSHAKIFKLTALEQFIESFDSPKSSRLIQSVSVERVLAMEREAVKTEFPPLHSLIQYWRIDLRGRSRKNIATILEELNSLNEVEVAWEDPIPIPSTVDLDDEEYDDEQGYQKAAPEGIDARWMWTQPDGEGAGIGIVDVEFGWLKTHEDLKDKNPTLIYGDIRPERVDHGTAVLGIILATDNKVGIVGCAPSISSVRMVSVWTDDGTAYGIYHESDSLLYAIEVMSTGDILLIEATIGTGHPLEIYDDRLDAIRLATALGILVVECAGNGDIDLDDWKTVAGTHAVADLHRLKRTSPSEFVDSGAIMVGASESALPHNRWYLLPNAGSNYGSRIDCFAWGENVTTTGGYMSDDDTELLDAGEGDPNGEYTDSFEGTSAAAPIIVGAAALLQSHYKANTGFLLSNVQLRTILSNPTTGTAHGTDRPGDIGVMPDLAAIVPTLGTLPDIYMRDAVGDTGIVPWTGPISVSPDIIVFPSSVSDPQGDFGEGSLAENSETLGSKVEKGHDNVIYVRVRNRGGSPATNVIATVYWSEVATLVTPSMWHLIGSVTLPTVPDTDELTVSPQLDWHDADIPSEGHYCFVATLQHPNDPTPPTPGPLSWSEFQDMIRAHNNVTWRNFNVENAPPTAPSTTSFDFNLAGAEDRRRLFSFEIERKLPHDTILEIEVPHGLLRKFKGKKQLKIIQDKDVKTSRLVLPVLPRIKFEDVWIPRGARLPCKFNIRPRKDKVKYGHGVSIRQLYKGKEVGRIVWQFAPKLRFRKAKGKKSKQ